VTVTIGDIQRRPDRHRDVETTRRRRTSLRQYVGDLSRPTRRSETHAYTLVRAQVDRQMPVQIAGVQLPTNASFDRAKSSYSAAFQSEDGQGATFEKQFTLDRDQRENDTPTDIVLTPATSLRTCAGTSSKRLSTADQDTATRPLTRSRSVG